MEKVEAMLKRNSANIRLQVYLDSYVLVPWPVSFVISPMHINQLPLASTVLAPTAPPCSLNWFKVSHYQARVSLNTLDDLHLLYGRHAQVQYVA